MQRHGNYDVVIVGGHRQLVAQVFHQCAPDRLIETVLVTANQRGQGARFVFGGGSIARDCACDSVAWRMREASSASGRVVGRRLERSAANFAARIRHQLDARDTSRANAASGLGAERRSARSAFGRVEKIQDRCKLLREPLRDRGHI